ncbi:MAG: HAMP domain-containing histidine kinase [Chloroflexi bacterium]|nr:HAMP domain-containing histidine kinase [Chloroflexota bacterium]
MTEQRRKKLDFIDATLHELKTPLTAIIVSAELLDEELKPKDGSVLGRLVQSIIRNAHNIDEKLSSFSEKGGFLAANSRFQPEPVKLGAIIHNVTLQVYPEIQSRKQSLSTSVPDSLPLVRADKLYLEQILLNLIDNATKFTPERGQIKVSARPDGTNVVIEVSDSGIGIPPEEYEKVFQPYYQIKKTSNLGKMKNHGGTGLGLAIAKSLVELHNGKIWLKSTVGQGSSFFFSLPKAV